MPWSTSRRPRTYRLCFLALILTSLLIVDASCRDASAQFGELIAFTSPGNTAYYVDAESGDDENTGKRPDKAWKTLGRVNITRFAPGDKIYLKSGTTYHGQLFPKGSGIPGNPVTIDAFGEDDPPAIHADGKHSAAILLENTNAWHVKHLELTNTADKPKAFRFGISILAEDTGPVGDFKLTGLTVRDIAGESNPGFGEGAAIIFRNRGDQTPSHFESLTIEDCTIENAQRHGISIESGYTDQPRQPANADVVIRSNVIKNVDGDGIRITGCNRALVEYNTIQQAGQSRKGEAGGIAIHHSDRCIVQFNDVAQTDGRSGAALYSGAGTRENTFQFNFTHDNAGAMFAAHASPQARAAAPSHNIENTLRYNISQNDKTAFRITGSVRDTQFYNNTVYTDNATPSVTLHVVKPDTSSSNSDEAVDLGPVGIVLVNNLFYTHARTTLSMDPSESGITCQTNAYFGEHQIPPQEPSPIIENPMLADPGQGESIEQGLDGYQLLDGSPLIGVGTRLPSHGRYDFWAQSIPAGVSIDVGAHQTPSDNTLTPGRPEREAVESAPDR